MDISAYFDRVSFTGVPERSLATLERLQACHMRAIPFENLDAWLGSPVRLDTASLMNKIVGERRGGYCYEHNLLFADVLQHLGFAVKLRHARVLWESQRETSTRSHLLLEVSVAEQRYLVDVGFGAVTPTRPLAQLSTAEQVTSHETFRVRSEGDQFALDVRLGPAWKPVYEFDLQDQLRVDCEPGNWYVSTHPDSFFVKNLIMTLPATAGRYVLMNDVLSTYDPDGTVSRVRLDSPEDVKRTIADVFGLGKAIETVDASKFEFINDESE